MAQLTPRMVETPRLTMNVWTGGPEDGRPVLLVHGNITTGRYWRYVADLLPDDVRVIAPDMPYSRFEARVTGLLARGADEGWVRFVLPASPSADETAYRLEFVDEDRFVQELEALVAPEASDPASR